MICLVMLSERPQKIMERAPRPCPREETAGRFWTTRFIRFMSSSAHGAIGQHSRDAMPGENVRSAPLAIGSSGIKPLSGEMPWGPPAQHHHETR